MFSKVGMQKRPPAALLMEFHKYGIALTGDKEADISALKEAKEANGESTKKVAVFEKMLQKAEEKRTQKAEGIDTPGVEKTPIAEQPPWSELMQSLGLELQGSKEADFAAMSEKLSQLANAVVNPEQKANLESLQAQYDKYYSQVQ